MLGTQTVSALNFKALPFTAATVVPIQVSAVSANQTNGLALFPTLGDNGRVVLINNFPLLEGRLAGSQLQLTLFAPAGPSYTLQTAPGLVPPIVWSPVLTTSVDSNLFQILSLPMTNFGSFFRVKVP